jgi:hypothetical protein
MGLGQRLEAVFRVAQVVSDVRQPRLLFFLSAFHPGD